MATEYPPYPQPPPELVRFRTFGAEGREGRDKEDVYDLLRGRLKFCGVSRFNDPFESRPHYKPKFTDAGKQRDAVLAYSARIMREGLGISGAEARRRAEDFMRGKTQEEIATKLGEDLNAAFAKGPPWVFCLSGPGAVLSPLTWAHYGDSHRGVCIHFDTRQPPFNLAWPIHYAEEYPEVTFPRESERSWDEVTAQILTKSECWSYEEEHRLICQGPGSSPDPRVAKLLVEWDGEVAIAPQSAVRAVTLGARMPAETRTGLREWIAANVPDVEIWQSRLHTRRYALERERVR